MNRERSQTIVRSIGGHRQRITTLSVAIATFCTALVLVSGGVAESSTLAGHSAGPRATVAVLTPQTLLVKGVAGNEPISYSGKGFHASTKFEIVACNSSVGKLKVGTKRSWGGPCDLQSSDVVQVTSTGSGILHPFAFTWPAVGGHPCPFFRPCCPGNDPFFPCHVMLAAIATQSQQLAAKLPVTYEALGNVSGGMTCTSVKGAMTFTPAVTSLTKGSYVQGLALEVAGCSPLSGASGVAREQAVLSHKFPWKKFFIALGEAVATVGGSLAGGLGGALVGGAATFISGMAGDSTAPSQPTTGNSAIDFTNYRESFTSTGDMVFTFPWTGGTASVAGAFKGSDGGATSTLTLVTGMTYAQAVKAVKAPGGLKSIKIVSGSLDLR